MFKFLPDLLSINRICPNVLKVLTNTNEIQISFNNRTIIQFCLLFVFVIGR